MEIRCGFMGGTLIGSSFLQYGDFFFLSSSFPFLEVKKCCFALEQFDLSIDRDTSYLFILFLFFIFYFIGS